MSKEYIDSFHLTNQPESLAILNQVYSTIIIV